MNAVSRLSTAAVAARIPYANAAPFYALWADAPFAVRNLAPRELGREAEAGGVDLGLMASADYLRLRDRFELLVPPLGLATRGPVQSVLMFSRRPAAALAGALVSVTPETSTSVRLLKLLLDVRRGLPAVRYLRGLEPAQADALLMIGDRAMRMRNQRPAGASLAAGLADLAAVARQQSEPGWSVAEMEAYLRRFHYRLGPEDLAGLERFEALLAAHGLLAAD